MISLRSSTGRLVLAPAVALLVACAPAPAPTPIPPTAAPAPTATERPADTPTPTPTTTVAATALPTDKPRPDDRSVTTEELTIRLPRDWETVELAGDTAGAVIERLREEQPLLGGIAGGTDAAAEVALAAVGPERAGFTDNLTIRRAPLGAERIEDLRKQVLDIVIAQYEKLGFAPVAGPDGAETVAHLPMGSIRYEIPRGAGLPPAAGQQFFVATDDDLWILTFSSLQPPGASEAWQAERSAATFEPR